MSSFFVNPFKRRRAGEEQELGAGSSAFTPDTPPNEEVLRTASKTLQRKSADCLKAVDGNVSCTASTVDVRSRAEYFESLIRTRHERMLGNAAFPKFGQRATVSSAYDACASASASTKTKFCAEFSTLSIGGLTAAAAADALSQLRLELERVERERDQALGALKRRTQEVENLREVVQQLTKSRSSALGARAALAERFCDLRREHDRVARIADLSREASKENVERAQIARSAAAEAVKEAANARKEAAVAVSAEHKAAAENAALREKISLLERRISSKDETTSACRQEYTAARCLETY